MMNVDFKNLVGTQTTQQSKRQRKKQQKGNDRKVGELAPTILKHEESKSTSSVQGNITDISKEVRQEKEIVKSDKSPLSVHEEVPSLVDQSKESEEPKVPLASLSQPSEIQHPIQEEQPINLNTLLQDLSLEVQRQFELNLEEQQEEIASFQSKFSKNNKIYLAQKAQLHEASIQKHFYELRETEKQQYQELKTTYSKLEQIFNARIKALTDAIANQLFEASLIEETIKGNDSYYNSFSILSLSMGYRYGAAFRLWELSEAMEGRRKLVGIKESEKPSPESSEIVVTLPSESCQKLAKVSRTIDILKEEVTICNEALKKEAKIVSTTELPRQYYIYHSQQLDAIKESLEDLKEEIEQQVAQLKTDLELESSTPDSPKALACQRELLEIEKRKVAILHRQGEIEGFLAQRKKDFKLEEKGLDTKEPVKLADLSPQYNQALSLIGRITSLKEDIVLSNNWEKFAPLEQRKVVYFQHAQSLEELKAEKSNFESQAQVERRKLINAAVLTYQGYIVNIKQGMEAIDTHIKLLERDSLERAGWQVALPSTPKVQKKEEVSKVDSSNGEGAKGVELDDKKTTDDSTEHKD